MTDLDPADEIRAHIAQRADDLVRAGVPRHEAERRARIEFGALERYREEARDASSPRSLARVPGQLVTEVRHALRRLRRTPAFTTFSVLSLAVGLGVTVAAYSILSVLLWPAQGLADPDRLVVLKGGRAIDWGYTTSRADLEDVRASQTTMAGVAAWTMVNASYIDGDVAERFRGEAVTGNAFEVLGIRMARGRPIRPADDRPASAGVVVLSHAFWTRQLRHDAGVIGRVVRIGGQPFEVIGVADRALNTIGMPDLDGRTGWIPFESLRRLSATTPPALDSTRRSAEALSIVGRLLPGRSLDEAKVELTAIGDRLDVSAPRRELFATASATETRAVARRWTAMPASTAFRVRGSALVWLLVALVALVLIVACTNLANLTLARGSARRQELAVRRALGASRWRLVREHVVESALVGAAGGLLSLIVVRLALQTAAASIAPGVQFHLETALSIEVYVAAALAMFLTLAVFGLWPALYLTKDDPRAALAGDAASGGIRWRTRRHLIVGQVMISAGFLFLAALCLSAIAAETRSDAGAVAVGRLAVARISMSAQGWDEVRTRRALDRVLELAGAQAGVEAVAITTGFPIGFTYEAGLATPAEPFAATRRDYPYARFISATPQLFRVLGLQVITGRGFDGRDNAASARVVVMSEAAARAVFGTARVVGQQLLTRVVMANDTTVESPVATVIGVVAEADASAGRGRNRGAVYVPYAQHFMPTVEVVARTTGDPNTLLAPLRTIVRRADPDLFASRSVTGEYRLDPARWGLRYFGRVASLLGAIVLVLAMAGLSGVLAHLVTRRTREMGVRMALGATRPGILGMVIRDGLKPVTLGIYLGVPAGLTAWFSFSPSVGLPTAPADLTMILLVPVVLLASAIVACYLPALRASRVNPIVALKEN